MYNRDYYTNAIKRFAARLENATGHYYNAVFYASGKYDFDNKNEEARLLIAAVLAAKGSERFAHRYRLSEMEKEKLTPAHGIYRDPAGDEVFLPDYVKERILERKRLEREAREKHTPLYDPNKFIPDNCETVRAYLSSIETIAKYPNGLPKTVGKQSFAGEFCDALAKQLREMSAAGIVGCALVILWVIAEIVWG